MKTTRLVALVLWFASAFVTGAAAQTSGERFEVAANLNLLRLSAFSGTRTGVGGRATFDLTPHLALEGEIAFYPKDRIAQSQGSSSTGTYQIVGDRRRTSQRRPAVPGVRVHEPQPFHAARFRIPFLDAPGGAPCWAERRGTSGFRSTR